MLSFLFCNAARNEACVGVECVRAMGCIWDYIVKF